MKCTCDNCFAEGDICPVDGSYCQRPIDDDDGDDPLWPGYNGHGEAPSVMES